MTNNSYPAIKLEHWFKTSTPSLIEHILTACDYFEHHVNLILIKEGGNPEILSQLNCSPEQKLMYLMGLMQTFNERDENGQCYIWGVVKEFYELRSRLHRLNAAALDKEVRKLCEPAKESQYHDEIMLHDTMKLWDYHCVAIAIYVEGYTSANLKDLSDLENE